MNNRLRAVLGVVAACVSLALFGGLGMYMSRYIPAARPDYNPSVTTDGVNLKPLATPGSPAGGKRK